MKTYYFNQNLLKQFLLSIFSVIAVASICYLSTNYIGYRSVALLLLATVSILAIFVTVFPILVAATLSALIWDFFFIPPHFTFQVNSSEDALLLLMYFVIALINGVLTSRVRHLEKMELQKEERQNAIKLYKTIFESISHELRTPIATIVGASDNLLQKNPNLSKGDEVKLVTEISIAAFRLNRLIDNLLNMQRLESGLLKAKLDWCDVNELIYSAINRLKDELTNHKLHVKIPNDIPFVKLDFGLMEQAIINILHNASLYTPANSLVTITVCLIDKHICIIISDNGKGINGVVPESIFSKFYRANKKNAGGIGLGLSIVKGFVESHHGTIKVENAIPSGAKFTILIPTEVLQLSENSNFADSAS
ncbi:MAG TPA: sensor histidine kinase [Bacteroidales bacterium]|nr:sensor histidine kinase [Bacteroidales bacterium]